jgi:peptidoglycan-associated lipoprotein
MEVELKDIPLNTAGSEFSPTVLGNELVFSSSKKEKIYKNNGQAMLGLYKISISQDAGTTQGTPFCSAKKYLRKKPMKLPQHFHPTAKPSCLLAATPEKRKTRRMWTCT